jgi:hypothetical protein
MLMYLLADGSAPRLPAYRSTLVALCRSSRAAPTAGPALEPPRSQGLCGKLAQTGSQLPKTGGKMHEIRGNTGPGAPQNAPPRRRSVPPTMSGRPGQFGHPSFRTHFLKFQMSTNPLLEFRLGWLNQEALKIRRCIQKSPPLRRWRAARPRGAAQREGQQADPTRAQALQT